MWKVTTIVLLVGVFAIWALDYEFDTESSECDKLSSVKFYYDPDRTMCYAARPACDQKGIGKLFDTIDECVRTRFPAYRKRTVSTFCGDVGSPLVVDQGNGKQGTYLFPPDCDVYGLNLCPDYTYCFTATHSYCCTNDTTKPNYLSFVFENMEANGQ